MATLYNDLFSLEDLTYLTTLPEASQGAERFTVRLTESIRSTLETRFGLDLTDVLELPMRWIVGDTAPHVDSGSAPFQRTHLVYLQSCPGQLVVGDETYSMTANTGYVFDHGLRHGTVGTESTRRLVLGPMSEQAFAVGLPPAIVYFTNVSDALNQVNAIAYQGNYFLVTQDGYPYNNWRIASNSTGSSSQSVVYSNGTFLDSTDSPVYYVYPAIAIVYFTNVSDALNQVNSISVQDNYFLVIQYGYPYTSWRIASNSTGSSSQSVVYSNGTFLDSTNAPVYYVYPATPCFLEGSTILCMVEGQDVWIPVEQLKPGTLVKTSLDGYKPVELIGKGSIDNSGTYERSENRLYKCPTTQFPELTADLYITGCHSILVDTISDEERELTIKQLGRVFVTDKKYRLMACLDGRAEAWASAGTYTIWHFALQHEDIKMNYGVYANGGLLVETCSINFMKNKSNMTLV